MNKIIVSIVITVLIILGINKLTNTIYYVEKPEKSSYEVANLSKNAEIKTVASSSEAETETDIKALLALGNMQHGEKVFKKCAACHSIAKGGSNKIGPALWNVLGRQSGSVANYKYSKALSAYNKKWSFSEMNGFLLKPKDWIKGTKMAFAGLKNEKDRASILLYLNSQKDNPIPLP